MANSNGLIAVIPWSRFKWTAEAQYKQSLYTQDEAIQYASQHGCNAIVKYEKRSGPLFDVFVAPDVHCTPEEGYETVEVVSGLEENKSARRSRSVFGGLGGLFRRSPAAAGTSQQGKALSQVRSQAAVVK